MSSHSTESGLSRYYVRFYERGGNERGGNGRVRIDYMEVSIDTEAQPKTEQFENELREGLAALCPGIEPGSWKMGRIEGPCLTDSDFAKLLHGD